MHPALQVSEKPKSVICVFRLGVLTKVRACSNNIAKAKAKGGHNGDSVLHEVQEKGGDKESQTCHTEESETCHSGCLLDLWHKGIQNRKSLTVSRAICLFYERQSTLAGGDNGG